ncbi:hypothetical protein PIROE2DRAFT_15553 [Piromyces sp. E2]|nr:hypothetical protein PIROE2DRAFT_15553 [Piromyces sp. E2]|eukprot:OUM59038.1 hypothetical protein PIROE2DRAFT_15553 [Piromyces sp. E2]
MNQFTTVLISDEINKCSKFRITNSTFNNCGTVGHVFSGAMEFDNCIFKNINEKPDSIYNTEITVTNSIFENINILNNMEIIRIVANAYSE